MATQTWAFRGPQSSGGGDERTDWGWLLVGFGKVRLSKALIRFWILFT